MTDFTYYPRFLQHRLDLKQPPLLDKSGVYAGGQERMPPPYVFNDHIAIAVPERCATRQEGQAAFLVVLSRARRALVVLRSAGRRTSAHSALASAPPDSDGTNGAAWSTSARLAKRPWSV